MHESIAFPTTDKKMKWLGIIDYESLMFLAVYVIVLWCLSSIFTNNILYQIYVLCIFTIPIVCMFIANKNDESIIQVLFIVCKYLFSAKIYVHIPYIKKIDEMLLKGYLVNKSKT